MNLNWIYLLFKKLRKRKKEKKEMWPTQSAEILTASDMPKALSKKEKKKLKSLYAQTVNSKRKTVYNFKTKRLEKNEKNWPILGYMCPKCDITYSWADHFLIGEESVCEFCARDISKNRNLL